MSTNTKPLFLWGFAGISLVNLIGEIFSLQVLIFSLRPLIFVLLVLHIFSQLNWDFPKFLIFLLLGFSCEILGDIVMQFWRLMDTSAYFITALILFALSCLGYLFCFNDLTPFNKNSFVTRQPFCALLPGGLVVGSLYYFWDFIPSEYRWITVIYSVALFTTFIFAINLFTTQRAVLVWKIILGITLLAISADLIGAQDFLYGQQRLPVIGFFESLTLIIGELLIGLTVLEIHQELKLAR